MTFPPPELSAPLHSSDPLALFLVCSLGDNVICNWTPSVESLHTECQLPESHSAVHTTAVSLSTMARLAGPPGPCGLLAVPGLGSVDVDSDEEVIGIRPKSSPLPRRRSSASEDDFDLDQPLSGSRRVSFADAKGLSLVHVKEFVLWDVPQLPDPSEGQDSEEYFISPLTFSRRPPEELITKVQEQMLELETVEILPGTTTLRGVVCVLNISFTKAVYVRTTLDCWSSHFDLLADYIPGSSVGQVDRFAFKLTLVPPFLDQRARVDFCLRYETPAGTFWANNDSRNYVLLCQRRIKDQRPQREKKSCLKSNSQNFTSTENVSGPEPSSQELTSSDVSSLEEKVERVNEAQTSERKPSWPGEEAQKSQTESRRNSRQRSRRKAARMARVREHFARRTDGDMFTEESETSGMSRECGVDERSQVDRADETSTQDEAEAPKNICTSSSAEERSDPNTEDILASRGSTGTFKTVVAPLYHQVFVNTTRHSDSNHVTEPNIPDLSCTSADAGSDRFILNTDFENPFESSTRQGRKDDATSDLVEDSQEQKTPHLDKHASVGLMEETRTHEALVCQEHVVKTPNFRHGSDHGDSTEDTSRSNDSERGTQEPADEDWTEDQTASSTVKQVTCQNVYSDESLTSGPTVLEDSGTDNRSEEGEALTRVDDARDVEMNIKVEDECSGKQVQDKPLRDSDEGRRIKTCDELSEDDVNDSQRDSKQTESSEGKDWEMMVEEEEKKEEEKEDEEKEEKKEEEKKEKKEEEEKDDEEKEEKKEEEKEDEEKEDEEKEDEKKEEKEEEEKEEESAESGEMNQTVELIRIEQTAGLTSENEDSEEKKSIKEEEKWTETRDKSCSEMQLVNVGSTEVDDVKSEDGNQQEEMTKRNKEKKFEVGATRIDQDQIVEEETEAEQRKQEGSSPDGVTETMRDQADPDENPELKEAEESTENGGERMNLETRPIMKETENLLEVKPEGQDVVENLDEMQRVGVGREGTVDISEREEEKDEEVLVKEKFGETFLTKVKTGTFEKFNAAEEVEAMMDEEDVGHDLTGSGMSTKDQIHNETLEERDLEQAANQRPRVKIRKKKLKIRTEDEGAATEQEQELKVKPEPTTEPAVEEKDVMDSQILDGEQTVKAEVKVKRKEQEETPRIKTRKSKMVSRMDAGLELQVPELKLESDIELKDELDERRENQEQSEVVTSTPDEERRAVDAQISGEDQTHEEKEKLVEETLRIKSRNQEHRNPESKVRAESEESLKEEKHLNDTQKNDINGGEKRFRNAKTFEIKPEVQVECDESGQEEMKKKRNKIDQSLDPEKQTNARAMDEPEERPGKGDGERPSTAAERRKVKNLEEQIVEVTLKTAVTSEALDRGATCNETPRVKARRAKMKNTKEVLMDQKLAPEESPELKVKGELDTSDETKHVTVEVKREEQNKGNAFERKAEKTCEETPRTKTRRMKKKIDKCLVVEPEKQTSDDPVSKTSNVRTEEPLRSEDEERHVQDTHKISKEEVKLEEQMKEEVHDFKVNKDEMKAALERNQEQEVGQGTTAEVVELKLEERIKEMSGNTESGQGETPRIKTRRSKMSKKKDLLEPGVIKGSPEVGVDDDVDTEKTFTHLVDKRDQSLVEQIQLEENLEQLDKEEHLPTRGDATGDVDSGRHAVEVQLKDMKEEQQESGPRFTQKPGVQIRNPETKEAEQDEREGGQEELRVGVGGEKIFKDDEIHEKLDEDFIVTPRVSKKNREDKGDKHLNDGSRAEEKQSDGYEEANERSKMKEEVKKETSIRTDTSGTTKMLEHVVRAEEEEMKSMTVQATVSSQTEKRHEDNQPKDKGEHMMEREEINLAPEKLQDKLKPEEVKVTVQSHGEKPRIKTRKTKMVKDFCLTDKNNVLKAAKENPTLVENQETNQVDQSGNESTPDKPSAAEAEEQVTTEREEKHTMFDAQLDFVETQTLENKKAATQVEQNSTEAVGGDDHEQEKLIVETPEAQTESQPEELKVNQEKEAGARQVDWQDLENIDMDNKDPEETSRFGLDGARVCGVAGGIEEDKINESKEQKSSEFDVGVHALLNQVHESSAGLITEDEERVPQDTAVDDWIESDDQTSLGSTSSESDSGDEVELYMHCLRVAHTGGVKDSSRDSGPSKRSSVCRNKVTSMPIISESLDEEQNLICSQDQPHGTSTAAEPAVCHEDVSRTSWREMFSCSNISKTLLYATLLGVFLTVAQRYDFLACLGLYLVSVVWLLCQREKQEKND